MTIEHYKKEVDKICSRYLLCGKYESMIQELAEYIDEETFQASCDARGD